MLDALSDDTELIAPCGMNCSVCSSYLAHKYDLRSKGVRMPYCTGCRPRDKKCAFLKKRCDLLLKHKVRFCCECSNSRAATWRVLTHVTKSITAQVLLKISTSKSSIRLLLLSSVKIGSGSVRSAEQSCAATMEFVTIAALITCKQ